MNRAELQREKLLNAMIFFAEKTRHCHKLKMFKLLYFLDFQIYRETGRSTSGLAYFAWKMGPVPKTLFDELEATVEGRAEDMNAALRVTKTRDRDTDFETNRLVFKPRRTFDGGCFTRRELNAMERLAKIFLDATAEQMSEASHVPGQPWHKIFKVEKKPQALIPYALVLDSKPGSITQEQADQIAEEEREARALFK